MTTSHDTKRAAAVVLCAKLEDLATAIDAGNVSLESGTVPCPICLNQSDNLVLMLDSQNGAVLCTDCNKASLI